GAPAFQSSRRGVGASVTVGGEASDEAGWGRATGTSRLLGGRSERKVSVEDGGVFGPAGTSASGPGLGSVLAEATAAAGVGAGRVHRGGRRLAGAGAEGDDGFADVLATAI